MYDYTCTCICDWAGGNIKHLHVQHFAIWLFCTVRQWNLKSLMIVLLKYEIALSACTKTPK